MKNIAIFSPNKNAYSETFIQAHKKFLKGKIHFLYGDWVPTQSEQKGNLAKFFYKNVFNNIYRILPGFIYNKFLKKSKQKYLKYYLKKEKIEIVLAEYGLSGAKNLKILKELNIKLIVHFHGFDASKKNILSEYKNEYIEMFNYANYIIVVSEKMKDNLIKLGCPKEKIVINTYGPDDSFFKVKPNFSKKQFIAIGRFVDKKAPYYTIFAFKKIVEKYKEAKLIMAGDGILLNTCKNIVKFLNIENNVVFPGIIKPEKYREFLNNSIAFVQHSITAENGDMEGTPVAILEASAAGIPVISTKHAGIPDVIINGETGFLCDEHDVESMYKNMLKVIEDIELAKKLGKAGKINISENFTMSKHIQKIQDLINES